MKMINFMFQIGIGKLHPVKSGCAINIHHQFQLSMFARLRAEAHPGFQFKNG